MSCRVRVAPALLAHVNLLLAVVGGAGVVTAVRLKWDPSTYVPLRQLFPQEYRVAGIVLCAGSAVLLLLVHLATVALALHPSRHRPRRTILILYASSMSLLACSELAWAGWMLARVLAWLRSDEAQDLWQALEVRNQLRPVLDFLGKWHPLPHRVNNLIEEAEADVPCNLYAAGALVALLAALQVAAIVLAAIAASAQPRNARARASQRRHSLSWASAGSDEVTSDKAPLKAVYRKGRLVMV